MLIPFSNKSFRALLVFLVILTVSEIFAFLLHRTKNPEEGGNRVRIDGNRLSPFFFLSFLWKKSF